jgi:hypothetical protein
VRTSQENFFFRWMLINAAHLCQCLFSDRKLQRSTMKC